MSAQQPIKLFDLRSTLSPQPWSPHTWRARFVLNYKKVPYITEFIGFPDIAAVLSAAGVPPTRPTDPKYTVPAIIDASADPHVILADSAVIADYLEKTYPEPSIYPHGREAHMRWTDAIMGSVRALALIVIPAAPRILSESDADFFVRTRKLIFGIDVEDMIASGPEEEATRWKTVEEVLNKVLALSDGVDHGDKWLFGSAQGPGYADFVLAGVFIWFQKAGPEGGWENIKSLNGGIWERHMNNVQQYMQVV